MDIGGSSSPSLVKIVDEHRAEPGRPWREFDGCCPWALDYALSDATLSVYAGNGPTVESQIEMPKKGVTDFTEMMTTLETTRSAKVKQLSLAPAERSEEIITFNSRISQQDEVSWISHVKFKRWQIRFKWRNRLATRVTSVKKAMLWNMENGNMRLSNGPLPCSVTSSVESGRARTDHV